MPKRCSGVASRSSARPGTDRVRRLKGRRPSSSARPGATTAPATLSETGPKKWPARAVSSIRSGWCAGTCARITSASWRQLRCACRKRTSWPARPRRSTRWFGETGWSRAVVKPLTGASGYSVELVAREEIARAASRLAAEARAGGVLVQEFPPRDRRWRAVADLFRRHLQPRRAQAPAAGRGSGSTRASAPRAAPRLPPRTVTEQGAAALRTLPEVAALCAGRWRRCATAS